MFNRIQDIIFSAISSTNSHSGGSRRQDHAAVTDVAITCNIIIFTYQIGDDLASGSSASWFWKIDIAQCGIFRCIPVSITDVARLDVTL